MSQSINFHEVRHLVLLSFLLAYFFILLLAWILDVFFLLVFTDLLVDVELDLAGTGLVILLGGVLR